MQGPEGHGAHAGDKGNACNRKTEGEDEDIGIGKHARLRADCCCDRCEGLEAPVMRGAEQRLQVRQSVVKAARG